VEEVELVEEVAVEAVGEDVADVVEDEEVVVWAELDVLEGEEEVDAVVVDEIVLVAELDVVTDELVAVARYIPTPASKIMTTIAMTKTMRETAQRSRFFKGSWFFPGPIKI
jgi:hypothetical protein